MKRRRIEDSTDALTLMTSSVMSSYSADGLRDKSIESAGSLHPDAREATSLKLQWIQSQRKDFQSQYLCIQTQEDKSIIVEEDSGEALDEPDASNSSIQSRATASSLSHTVEAVVHLWSLGVLTAAGCGIGSVHAVVRSNLLVEPSEVEEGETDPIAYGPTSGIRAADEEKQKRKRRRAEDSADGLVIDDVIGDVIIFSRWFVRAVARYRISSSRKLQWIQSQRKDFQSHYLCIQTQEDKSIIVEEDSGEALDEPDASNNSIQSQATASSRKENKAQRYPVVVMDQQRSS
ncbi:hypothetical protein F511_28949 [Dorcoceras hygrometricum]|uniref:Uncharacterized protein n=1 Tax=Dorcoceras hygrometricum TaxID=472368 RepID=A0A2Z7D4M1_9LAMI|nr:hypothetical protein F511_28949 [Dorcoceras hygrometricum]